MTREEEEMMYDILEKDEEKNAQPQTVEPKQDSQPQTVNASEQDTNELAKSLGFEL